MKFFVRDHCSTFEESMKTIHYISYSEFLRLLTLSIYKPYGFDMRSNQVLWILKDISKYSSDYKVWLGIQSDS